MEEQQSTETPSPSSPGKMHIFIRRSNKQAIKIKVGQSFAIDDLKKKLFKLFGLNPEDYALLYNGVRVDQIEILKVEQKNNIIHLIDLRNITNQQISVDFREMGKLEKIITLKVKANKSIKSLLDEDIRAIINKGSREVFLIYLGKVLKNSKTLVEQLVEEHSQIIIHDLKQKSRKNKIEIIQRTYHKEESPLKESGRILSPRPGGGQIDYIKQQINSKRKKHNDNVEKGQAIRQSRSMNDIPLPNGNNEEDKPTMYNFSQVNNYGSAAPTQKEEKKKIELFKNIGSVVSQIHYDSENDQN